MTTADTLRAARALIEKPERWAQGAVALKANGEACPATSNSACQWCASGAVEMVAQDYKESNAALRLLYEVIGSPIGEFNDDHTHAEVIAAFDRAVELAEQSK